MDPYPLSKRVGDALQLAEPIGDAVGDAFARAGRRVRPIAKPGLCEQFGSRFSPAGMLAGFAPGLYVPELNGARSASDGPDADTSPERSRSD